MDPNGLEEYHDHRSRDRDENYLPISKDLENK